MHAIIESGGVGWRAHGLASPSWPQGRERRTSMSKAALIRLTTGIAGLIAWGLILFNGLERTCSR